MKFTLHPEQIKDALHVILTEAEFSEFVTHDPPPNIQSFQRQQVSEYDLDAEDLVALICELVYLVYNAYHHEIPISIRPDQDIYLVKRAPTPPLPEQSESMKSDYYINYFNVFRPPVTGNNSYRPSSLLQVSNKSAVVNLRKPGVEATLYVRFTMPEERESQQYCTMLLEVLRALNDRVSWFDKFDCEPVADFFREFQTIDDLQVTDLTHLVEILELSNLLRRGSPLLRIRNLSMLNYLKCNNQFTDHLKERFLEEEKLLEDYDHYLENKQDDDIMKTEMNLEDNTKKFFFEDLGEQINAEDSNTAADLEETYLLRFQVRYTEETVKLSDKVFQLTGRNMETEAASYVPEFVEFFIEYSSERNSLSVVLTADVHFAVEVSDILMFTSNLVSTKCANVSIQVVEKYNGSFNKLRFVTFKANSCFTTKEPILQKTLVIMDTLLVVKSVMDYEIRRMKVSYSLPRLARKIQHYMNIFKEMADELYPSLHPQPA